EIPLAAPSRAAPPRSRSTTLFPPARKRPASARPISPGPPVTSIVSLIPRLPGTQGLTSPEPCTSLLERFHAVDFAFTIMCRRSFRTMSDTNPFPPNDAARRAIWDMLVQRDIRAFVAGDWESH